MKTQKSKGVVHDKMDVKQIKYPEILYVWRNKLWVNRKSEIRPTNGMKFLGGYEKELEQYSPTFFGVFLGNELIGVNSGHATSYDEYRSRGIYVSSRYRRTGVAQLLFRATEEQAKKENKHILWSMPRKKAIGAYLRFGFERVSRYFNEGVEFGPNCYVVKILLGD